MSPHTESPSRNEPSKRNTLSETRPIGKLGASDKISDPIWVQGGSPMHTKEEREGILREFHRSDLSAPAACRSLPLFPNKDNLHAWLKLEEAGEPTAREMPDRAERMHCSHGEGSPAFAARRAGAAPASPRRRRAEGGAGKMKRTGRGGAGGAAAEQTEWRGLGPGGASGRPRRARPRGRGQARRRWSTGRTARRSSGGCGRRKRRDRPRRSRPGPGRAPTPGRGTARPGSGPASSARRRSGRR